jgi:hypothetical protein
MMTIEECEYWYNWLEEQVHGGSVKIILIGFPNQYPGVVIEYNLN